MKLFTKIFTAVFLTVASIFYFSGVIPFTSAAVQFNPVQSAPAYLSGAGITAVQTTIPITSFVTRQGTPITTANIGGIGYATIDAGTSKEENISFTGVTQNINGTAVLTGASRGLQDVYPYTATTSLAIAHSGGATVITSNSGAFYSQFNIAPNPSTVTGLWTFDPSAIPSYSSAPTFSNSLQIIDKAYVDSVATSGAPDASQSAKGLVQIATPSQIASGTATTTDGAQTLWNVVGVGQYGKTYGATPTVLSQAYGSATGTASTSYSFSYTGSNGSFTLPALGVPQTNGHSPSSSISMTATLMSSNGGNSLVNNYTGGLGRSITANLSTTTFPLGTTVYYSVSSAGASSGDTPTAVPGGYADGQNSPTNGSSYVGGGGGGSTWISTTNGIGSAQLVACGGGGAGGQTGLNGGNGGGGSCPANGGSPLSNGGVGSYLSVGATNISTSTASGNGSITVVYTYSYNDPTENVSSTVSGNNFGGTVTVSASTAHLSPTTSTINFAPWTFQNAPSGVSCNATTWGSSLAPFIIAENTSSVEFGFGSTIAGGKYDYNCLPR